MADKKLLALWVRVLEKHSYKVLVLAYELIILIKKETGTASQCSSNSLEEGEMLRFLLRAYNKMKWLQNTKKCN